MISRRDSLALMGATALASAVPGGVTLASAHTDSRLIVIVLRGGLDGLAAVAPYGDADYASQRGGLALGKPGTDAGVLDLDGTFGLHPALDRLHAMYRARELIAFHAMATPYRRRSHFDAQDLLENGTANPSGARDGWLNRALSLYGAGGARLGLAVGNTIPLLLRGDTPVGSFAPGNLAPTSDDFLNRVAALYRDDRQLGPAFAEALRAQEMSDEILGESMNGKGKRLRRAESLPMLARDVGKLLTHPAGARIAVLEAGGWDTHANQGVLTGRLVRNLKGLNDGVQALKENMAQVWNRTAVLVVSEFGRTVRPNGTNGTDHGTAGISLLAGGAVTGGRVIADWPGLANAKLHEGRDLAPTTDLRSVLKAVLTEHLGLSPQAVDAHVLPDSAGVVAQRDLFRS